MKISVFGAGTWGTALAQTLADNKQDVLMYARDGIVVRDINEHHMNTKYFEGVILPSSIYATSSIKEAVKDAEIILLSVPTKAMRSLLSEILPFLTSKVIFVNTAKGFDVDKDERISSLIREMIPEEFRFSVVSLIGPSHAEEVILRHLTLVASVSLDEEVAKIIQEVFSNSYFRVYTLTDEIGAELSVAMKNAIALASGMIAGLDLGDNARAALVTRGLAEIVRFGSHFGGNSTTFQGLTGIGDLMVTCYSNFSRNYRAGYLIGKENGVEDFFKNNKMTVEGIRTVQVIHRINEKEKLDLPIIDALYGVLYEGIKPSDAAYTLMVRPLKSEIE